jgi:hypothetical protein
MKVFIIFSIIISIIIIIINYEGFVKRSDLFLQTKYTPIGGQDPNNVPYDPSEPIEIQVLLLSL